MNSLSWLIYLAGVCDNVGQVFIGLSVLLGLGVIALTWIHIYMIMEYFHDRCRYGKDDDTKRPFLGYPILCGVAFFVCVLVATLVPSKDTVLAIAASQTGEQVLKTPLAQKAEASVESWLDAQTAANKAKTETKEITSSK